MENRMNGNAVRVWTKQHENVLRELETKGRYVARREYIQADLGEHAPLVLEAYDWLVKHTPAAADRPADADYPVWVSLKSEATMLKSPGTVILELTLGPVPDRTGEHHEMGSGPGLFLYPGEPGGRCPAQKAPGGIPGQRQQGIYVPVLPGDQTGDHKKLGPAL